MMKWWCGGAGVLKVMCVFVLGRRDVEEWVLGRVLRAEKVIWFI